MNPLPACRGVRRPGAFPDPVRRTAPRRAIDAESRFEYRSYQPQLRSAFCSLRYSISGAK